jgi:Protein of unknown function (DUF3307)
MMTVAVEVLIWLQIKHFVADYLLQPDWVLAAKGDMRRMGGYVHAGIHAIGSLPAYLIAGVGLGGIAALVVVEFVVHYVIDFIKSDLSSRSRSGPNTAAYWALHGADQLAHQLTYVGLVVAVASLTSGQ